MTDKAYIVVNEQQEREVLEKTYKKGKMWPSQDGRGNYWSPVHKYVEFPYVIVDCGKRLIWTNIDRLTDEEIIFDGRKEERMSEKYVVSQEFMNELKEWKAHGVITTFVNIGDLSHLPLTVYDWWVNNVSDEECNNRLIAILRWVNGEDVFEVEKPKKWVVRSKDSSKEDRHLYVRLDISYKVKDTTTLWGISNATRFDTKEEAQSWANSHQEVVEVDE